MSRSCWFALSFAYGGRLYEGSLKTARVPSVVQFAKAIGTSGHSIGIVHTGHRNRNRKCFLMLQYLSTTLPGESPRCYYNYLRNKEQSSCYYCLTHVNTHSWYRWCEVLVLHETRVLCDRRTIAHFSIALETEFIRYLDRLYQEKILSGLRRRTALSATVTYHRT